MYKVGAIRTDRKWNNDPVPKKMDFVSISCGSRAGSGHVCCKAQNMTRNLRKGIHFSNDRSIKITLSVMQKAVSTCNPRVKQIDIIPSVPGG